jgi:predicted enzyme related to lactoylglutathione lyase
MNTAFLGLRTATYRVSNLPEATAWYENVLGIQPYFNEPFYVGFNVGGYELGLSPDDDISPEKQRSVETYWGVEDIQASYDRLIEQGARPSEPPTDVGGGILVATVLDPWGNVLGIIYNPHFVV